jgi:EmrB/QacA subfamily drug resistance transporter
MNPMNASEISSADKNKIKRILPLIVGISLFMDQLDSTIVNAAIPSMSLSFGVAPLSLKSVMTSYIISLAIFITLSGWMADRFGTRRIFTLAVVGFTSSSFLCGISTSVDMLTFFRVIQGISAALMMPVGRLLILRTFEKSELLRAMNYVIIPALIGPLLGPSVGGLIIHWFSWPVIFFINIPIGIAILFFVNRYVPDYKSDQKKSFDWIGFFLFGGGLGLLTWMLDLIDNHYLNFNLIVLGIFTAMLMIAGFIFYSFKASAPLLSFDLFKIRTFRISILGGFFSRLGMGGLPFILPFLYQIGLGFPAWKAGLLTVPTALAAIAMKIYSQTVLASLGYKRVLILNTVLISFVLFFYARVGKETSIELIVFINLILGLLSSLQMACINSLVFSDIAKNQSSAASTISSSVQQLTLNFGLTASALVIGFFLGNFDPQLHDQTLRAIQLSFIALGSISLLSTLWFFYLADTDGKQISGHN